MLPLLGGAVETQFANPFEYWWRLATALNAECSLFPAPLIVDSAETRTGLMEDRQIGRLITMARSLDLAVVSAGDISADSGSLARHLIDPRGPDELLELGGVADIVCNFLDRDGRLVPHPLNGRSMPVGLGAVRNAGHAAIGMKGSAACSGPHWRDNDPSPRGPALRCFNGAGGDQRGGSFLRMASSRAAPSDPA